MLEEAPSVSPFAPLAARILTAVGGAMRAAPPQGFTVAEVGDWLDDNGPALHSLVESMLVPYRATLSARGLLGPPASAAPPAALATSPDLWTAPQRTAANLRAMQLLAARPAGPFSVAEQRELAAYSGWGGLSLRRVSEQFPPGFPVPTKAGLVHEYYTPTVVADAAAMLVRGVLAELPRGPGGRLRALEPSAGIGRFIAGAANAGLDVDWQAVEFSEVSARLLRARWPSLAVFSGPFERFADGPGREARFELVLSNPPYGPRGATLAEDSQGQSFRAAYRYFLARTVGMLVPGGLGVYLIPGGFLTGRGQAATSFRALVLREAHLWAAFRLPSVADDGKETLFPGANLVTDLVLLRRRGAALRSPAPTDARVLAGDYFADTPAHVLGREVGNDGGDDDTTRKPRFGYEVRGAFSGFPSAVAWRPFSLDVEEPAPAVRAVRGAGRGSVARTIAEADDTDPAVREADALGLRVDRYLAQVAAGDAAAADVWRELVSDLDGWVDRHGAPASHPALTAALARSRATGLQRFVSVFSGSRLLPALADAPTLVPAYNGPAELVSVADWLYRQRGHAFHVAALAQAWSRVAGGTLAPDTAAAALERAGWCEDEDAWLPAEAFLTGHLWPRVDRMRPRAARGDARAARQLDQLLRAIEPATWADLVEGLTPRESWLPMEVVSAWAISQFKSNAARYTREGGVVHLLSRADGAAVPYHRLPTRKEDFPAGLPHAVIEFIGYCNNDGKLWKPPVRTTLVDGEEVKETLDAARVRVAEEWSNAFREWLRQNEPAQALVEEAYNRRLRGYIPETYPDTPIEIARWSPGGLKLHSYQVRAARRLLANRRGLLAFDVGLGKTVTGLAVLARARQEGWARRPVVLVPNSIVWKWHRDFAKNLPDYRVLVIGSNRKRLDRGPRAGRWTSVTDTPEERAQKWAAFQAGAADVVLLTMSMIGRTKVDPDSLQRFAARTAAIRRLVTLARAEGAPERKPRRSTERKEAVAEEAAAGWLMGMLQAGIGQEYDPGVAWEDLGVDFLMVDEAQNYKNLFLPEEREGGAVEGMGKGEESKRAWHLSFRAESVRQRTGGAGVVLLSATPAKNSPLEFYNAIALMDPQAFEEQGISDPESFITRYCGIEQRLAQAPNGQVLARSAVTHFRHLPELRSIIFRFAEFKTAEDVALPIPGATNERVTLQPTAEQEGAIAEVFGEIMDLQEQVRKLAGAAKGNPSAKARMEAIRMMIMGLSQRVDLIALHPALPSVSGDKADGATIDRIPVKGRSPKIESAVRNILETRAVACDPRGCSTEVCFSCGHIVFVENVAVHRWVRRALVDAGVPAERIAILNAREAKDPETRQQIAEGFNGAGCPEDDTYVEPRFDIVIANSVAYEGIDLQRRTCAIHHLDLPWEPATLQQRNGRGVRQGNRFEEVRIFYYLLAGTLDVRRVTKIDTKASWMKSLVSSQDRTTNNPAIGGEMGIAEIALALAPPKYRAQLEQRAEEERVRAEADRLARIARAGNARLATAHERFRRAERSDAADAARLREEGERILAETNALDVRGWPWARLASRVRHDRAHILPVGPPLYAGLRLRLAGQLVEVGRLRTLPAVRVRRLGQAHYRVLSEDELELLGALTPADVNGQVEWEEDAAALAQAFAERFSRASEWSGLLDTGWLDTPAPLQDAVWPVVAPALDAWLRRPRSAHAAFSRLVLPIEEDGALRLVAGGNAVTLPRAAQALPPTDTGWARFLALQGEARRKRGAPPFEQFVQAAVDWWDRNLRVALRQAGEAAEEAP